jgi:hypothetical protein
MSFVFLHNFDENGRPTTGLTSTPVPDAVLEEVDTLLPNGGTSISKTRPDWVRDATINLVEPAHVSITFLSEGAGYRNALSYIVYPTDSPPRTWKDVPHYMIFPNASLNGKGGSLATGDTMLLPYNVVSTAPDANGNEISTQETTLYPAGTTIAFCLHANMWAGTHVRTHPWRRYYTYPYLNPEKSLTLQHHAVMYKSSVDDRLIIGMEDINRSPNSYSDHDFNDIVFQVTASPFTAINLKNVNKQDQQAFSGTIMCEAARTKADDPLRKLEFKDLFVEYEISEKTDPTNDNLSLLDMTFLFPYSESSKLQTINENMIPGTTQTGRKTSKDLRFGFVVPGLSALSTNMKIIRETYEGATGVTVSEHSPSVIVQDDVLILIPSTRTLMPPKRTNRKTNHDEQNNEYRPSRVKVRMAFDTPTQKAAFTTGLNFPYRFQVRVQTYAGYKRYDIHNDELYDTEGEYGEAAETPRILVIPNVKNFQPNKKSRSLHEAYPRLKPYLLQNRRYVNAWFNKLKNFAVDEGIDTVHASSQNHHPWFDRTVVQAEGVTLVPLASTTNTSMLTWEQVQTNAPHVLALSQPGEVFSLQDGRSLAHGAVTGETAVATSGEFFLYEPTVVPENTNLTFIFNT